MANRQRTGLDRLLPTPIVPVGEPRCLTSLSVASCNVSTGQNMYPKVLDVYAQRRVAEDQTYNGRIFLVLAIGAGADWYLQRLCGIVRFMLEAYARERAGPHIVQRGMAPEATHAGAEQSWQVWEEKRGLTLAAQLMHKGCAKDGVKDCCGVRHLR